MTTPAFTIWTIGHSNHPLERFTQLLLDHQIQVLADVRRFPGSRKYPHFKQENLDQTLGEHGLTYRWFEGLGGRRSKAAAKDDSPNEGLRNQSFRNYADYMLSDTFREAFNELRSVASEQRTAMMCSESVFWRCHRRLVSDYALASGGGVNHIFPDGRIQPHTLTVEAVVQPDPETKVLYPGDPKLF
ncbi:DUF488 domain-containing protein [Roseimaritima sediminicola]|uniref:DUF488 domain-containing protein n=1 Tax=Roseimaritima sediminicola TaxID=2662066 RepID=UPI00129854F0|nr:DUF488 domain-containing protein [Roseimaritima sediminicola]